MSQKADPSSLPLIRKTAIATIDQALLSALSFLVSVLLIKLVPKAEYGYYSIAFAVWLFLASLQDAVVNSPLAVLLASKSEGERKEYAGSLCFGQFLLLAPAALVGLLTVGFLRSLGWDPVQASIGAALCFASVGLLFREYLRSYWFAEQKPGKVLRMDLLYAALFLVLTGLSWALNRFGVATVFLLMGASAFLTALLFIRSRKWRYQPDSIRKGYRENWVFGRWALIGVCVTHVQKYSYLYFLGAMLGSIAVADVSAARLLLMPLIFAQIGWSKVVIPHGSKLREEGRMDRFFKEQIVACLVFLAAIALYVSLLLVFSAPIQKLLLSEKYSESFHYIPFWGLVFAVGFVGVNASYGLQVAKDFRIISVASALILPVTVGASYLLIRERGIAGSLEALILGESLLAFALWFHFAKAVLSEERVRRMEGFGIESGDS